jgi:hypothetical protein
MILRNLSGTCDCITLFVPFYSLPLCRCTLVGDTGTGILALLHATAEVLVSRGVSTTPYPVTLGIGHCSSVEIEPRFCTKILTFH